MKHSNFKIAFKRFPLYINFNFLNLLALVIGKQYNIALSCDSAAITKNWSFGDHPVSSKFKCHLHLLCFSQSKLNVYSNEL